MTRVADMKQVSFNFFHKGVSLSLIEAYYKNGKHFLRFW